MGTHNRVLNVLVAGHAQHGKSSLIESIVGKFPDFLKFELTHGTTVSLKVLQFELGHYNLLVNFFDSPGHSDFQGGIALGLEYVDLLLLVISGTEGFQARTYWLIQTALELKIPVLIAATKMDLPSANTDKILKELSKITQDRIKIISTSAKKEFRIDELIESLPMYVKHCNIKENEDLRFIILGYKKKKGVGELLQIGIYSGVLEVGNYISDKIKVRQIINLKGTTVSKALTGDVVQISLNVLVNFDLGTIYYRGKFKPPQVDSLLTEIYPRKEFSVEIADNEKFKVATDIIESLKKVIPSFDYITSGSVITLHVVGDLQFKFIKEELEGLIDFKILSSKIKGIITINKITTGKYRSAGVRIFPKFKNQLIVTRKGSKETKLYDILGASAAYNAFHLNGLHIDINSGKSEEDIARSIAIAIEKAEIIKVTPYQDVIIKIENFNDIFTLIEQFKIEVLHHPTDQKFFLQVKNKHFEAFFNALMKASNGKAEFSLLRFEKGDHIVGVDPGTRHIGFSYIRKGELPSLWYVNLKQSTNSLKSRGALKRQVIAQLDLFLQDDKELVSKVFVGNGPGFRFIIDVLTDYFNIKGESENIKRGTNSMLNPPDLYIVDEFKTTKEAIFHLKQERLVNEVKTKGFVDHAVAALLIAKRGIKGKSIKIEKKPLKQLFDYIIENYSGSYSFSRMHKVNSINDLKAGMYLRVKDPSMLDSNLNKGDIVMFIGFGTSYTNFQAKTLSGNVIIVKMLGKIRMKKEFFNIFTPVRERAPS